MAMKLLTLALFAGSLSAQPVITIGGPPGNIKAGATFQLTLNITGLAGTGDQALQFSLSGISGWSISPATGTAAVAAGKTLTCAAVAPAYNCVVEGAISLMTDGQIAVLNVTLPAMTPPGTTSIALSNLLAAVTTTTGNIIGGAINPGPPFPLSIINTCDLSGDGVVNASDMTIMRSQVLGTTVCTVADLNADKKCNILDTQILDRAIATGSCATGVAGIATPPPTSQKSSPAKK